MSKENSIFDKRISRGTLLYTAIGAGLASATLGIGVGIDAIAKKEDATSKYNDAADKINMATGTLNGYGDFSDKGKQLNRRAAAEARQAQAESHQADQEDTVSNIAIGGGLAVSVPTALYAVIGAYRKLQSFK